MNKNKNYHAALHRNLIFTFLCIGLVLGYNSLKKEIQISEDEHQEKHELLIEVTQLRAYYENHNKDYYQMPCINVECNKYK